jgi:MoxR-like ATPase
MLKEMVRSEVCEAAAISAAGVRAKFEATASELQEALVERDDEIAIAMNAVVSNEHVFLKGAPGEAKSLLADTVANWMNVRRFFVLLNGQSTLNDIFGPVSISALKQDLHRRNTAGKLPEAEVAFVDEPFRGNSAVRNAMLRIMNERQYELGDGTYGTVPLKFLIAASNDWPRIEDEAEAFFDRFLFRKEVKTIVSSSGISKLLWPQSCGSDHIPMLSTSLGRDELALARSEAASLPWSNEAMEAMSNIVFGIHEHGIFPSPRRLVKSKKAAQAAAWLEGSEVVNPEHLAILTHTLWVDPVDHPSKVGAVVLKHANPMLVKISQMAAQAEQIAGGTKTDDFIAVKSSVSKLREIEKKMRAIGGDRAVSEADKIGGLIAKLRASAA